MNSKLRNSLSAFAASAAVLAIALMAAVPAGTSPVIAARDAGSVAATGDAGSGSDRIDSLAQAIALSAGIAAASALAFDADSGTDAETSTRPTRKGARHRRQTVVMPYFSFSPRG